MPRNTMGRRAVLGLAIPAVIVALPWRSKANADPGGNGDPLAPIRELDAALLSAMKAGQRTPFAQRYAMLAPVVEQTFDLGVVLAASVGLDWAAMPDDQKQRLLAAFTRYTVASYTANFDNFTGQTFQVAQSPREIGNGEVVVGTTIVAADGSSNRLDYVMRDTTLGWKAVDVLADGSISRVAVQRSDFRHLLSSGGPSALVEGLQHKVANLSGGMAA